MIGIVGVSSGNDGGNDQIPDGTPRSIKQARLHVVSELDTKLAVGQGSSSSVERGIESLDKTCGDIARLSHSPSHTIDPGIKQDAIAAL
jgi:hypothetical protein